MVPLAVEIEPGRGLIQFPHARGDAVVDEGVGFAVMGQAVVGPLPDAGAVREHFAAPAVAAAAGAVSGVFGAVGFRA